MATIKFVLKSQANPAAIYVRLIDGRKTDVMAKTNYFINPEQWSKARQRPKNINDEVFKKLNSDLNDIKNSLLNHFNASNGITINTEWLKNFINPPDMVQGFPTRIVSYIDFYNSDRKRLSPNSKIRFNVTKHKLERYEKHIGQEVHIKDVDKKFQSDFEAYCLSQSYAHNTTAREIVFIKTICKHAKENGLETHHQMEGLKTEYKDVDSIYLTETELLAIKKTELKHDYLDNARDWLLISCYTGQRVSDFLRFDKSMIRQQTNRKGEIISLIEFTQQKTKKIMTIPLHTEVVEILKKRDGDFPRALSDQKYNKYIKLVCAEAKLTEMVKGSKQVETSEGSKEYRKESGTYPKHELVSSHIGRRSFATNFYGKIPTPLLMAATGHSTEKMFLTYIGKSSSDMAIGLSEWF